MAVNSKSFKRGRSVNHRRVPTSTIASRVRAYVDAKIAEESHLPPKIRASYNKFSEAWLGNKTQLLMTLKRIDMGQNVADDVLGRIAAGMGVTRAWLSTGQAAAETSTIGEDPRWGRAVAEAMARHSTLSRQDIEAAARLKGVPRGVLDGEVVYAIVRVLYISTGR